MTMKKIWLSFICTIIISSSFLVFAQIPNEYLPNSHINAARTSILNTLTELQAYRKTWNEVPPSMFSALNANFKTAFRYFPSNPSYSVIYKQCDITTAQLSSRVDYDDYNTFVSKCFDPLSSILKDIQNNYTIKSVVKANPRSGQAPLSVTFDASASIDPSKETIPSDNFFRYYTDTDGKDVIIWKGPTVNHVFNKAGNYVVHSTVRSINNLQGYFDADNSITVSVQPTDTKINILANGVKLDENNPTKLSLSEGTDGITLDATSTSTSQGKRLMRHTWNITSTDGFNRTVNGDGTPGSLDLKLGSKGSYKVTLSTTDNTNVTNSKSFQIILSDPVSKIRSNPSAGTTSTQFAFDGDTSYSVSNKVNLYRWDLYDADSNILITSQEKNLRYQFATPGQYTAKLTVIDQQWISDSSQIKVAIESTPPVAQYTITPTSDRSNPSQFILDATSSFDYDILNNNDSLTYERWFSDPDNTQVIDQSEDNKQIHVQFNTKGIHKVKLKVTDSYGKIAELTKNITVNSSLRPVMSISPIAASRWSKIDFSATANKNIINYIRNFGDGTSRTVQSKSLSHVFEKVWVYKVSLTATSSEWETNTVSALVYIGENKAPIGVYDVIGQNNQLLLPTDECEWVPAYSIPRYQSISIDSSKSVDVKGQRANVKVLFKPQNDDVYNTTQLRYKFGEIGCQYVEMIVEDKEDLTADKKKIRFKVKNGLPKLNNIYLNFPQYSNDVGIWLFQYNAPKDPNFEQFDPLVVRVNIDSPVDLDGSISYIARYYYKPEDPDRLLDIKVTPGNSNAVNFAISREAWEYTFGAKIIDNDGGEIASEDIIWKGPSIFIKPKGNDSVDIPLVTFKTDINNTKIGEEVTFTVVSRVLSNRPDFKANRIIKFDFDGDGTDDLTTKDDVVKFVYTSPSPEGKPFKPKAKVIYRDKVWVWYAESITVKKWLKPSFLLASYDKKILIRDTTYGADEKTQLEYCLDDKNCSTSTIKWERIFTYVYPDYGTYTIQLRATDSFWNEVEAKKTIELKAPARRLYIDLMSTPNNKQTDNGFELEVGKSLSNQIILYPQYFGSGKCYLDINLTDGDDDNDIECNKVHTIDVKSIGAQVYYKFRYENSKGLTSKVIKINLLDNQAIVPEQYKEVSEAIGKLIDTYSNKTWYTELVTVLQSLGQNLGDKEKTTEYLIDLDNLIKKGELPKDTTKQLTDITKALANAGFRATQWLSEYERTKAEILAYANPSLEQKLSSLFEQIENTSDKQVMYDYLSDILALYGQEVSAWTLEEGDFTIIKWHICTIVTLKEIPGTKCAETGTSIEKPATTTVSSTDSNTDATPSSGLGSVLKRILWIIWIAIGIFLVLVIVFAVKARMDRGKAESSENNESAS